jgi:hypothetical protein
LLFGKLYDILVFLYEKHNIQTKTEEDTQSLQRPQENYFPGKKSSAEPSG